MLYFCEEGNLLKMNYNFMMNDTMKTESKTFFTTGCFKICYMKTNKKDVLQFTYARHMP